MEDYPFFSVGDRVETVVDITGDYNLPAGSVGTITGIAHDYMLSASMRKDVYPITVEMDAEFVNDGSYQVEGRFHPSELAVIGQDNDEALAELDFGAILAAM